MAIDKRSPQTFYRMKYRKGAGGGAEIYEYDIEPSAPAGPTQGTIPQLLHDLNNGDTGEHVLVGDTTKLAHINPSNFNPPPSTPSNTRTLRLYRSGNFVTYPSDRDIQYLRTGLVTGTSPIDPTKTGHTITSYYTKYDFTDGSTVRGFSGFVFARMQNDMKSCYFAIIEADSTGSGSIRLYKGNVLTHDRKGDGSATETDPDANTDATNLMSVFIDRTLWTTNITTNVNVLRIALQVENQPTPGEVGIRVLVRTASPISDMLNPTKGSWVEAISVIDSSSPYTTGALGIGGVTPSGTFNNNDMQQLKYLFGGIELWGYTV